MPYIEDAKRGALEFENALPVTPGELNYAISSLTHRYLKAKGLTYANVNEAVGVLECVKLELYRTVAAPYEDGKRAENGKVSDLDRLDMAPAASPDQTNKSLKEIMDFIASKLDGEQPQKQAPTAPQAVVQPAPAALAPAAPATSNVRRAPRVIGEQPGPDEGTNVPNPGTAPAVELPAPRPPKDSIPKGVDRHVADVWSKAASGNGEDDEF